jgi:hypothetical protein
MRYLICLLIGLFVGAITATMLANALQQRHPWSRGLMNVMQHELGDARTAAKGNACATPAMQSSAAHLRLLAGDLDRALLAPGAKDRVLSQYIGDFGKTLSAWDPAADCARQAEALTAIANACEACHRDYR